MEGLKVRRCGRRIGRGLSTMWPHQVLCLVGRGEWKTAPARQVCVCAWEPQWCNCGDRTTREGGLNRRDRYGVDGTDMRRTDAIQRERRCERERELRPNWSMNGK